MDSSWPRCAVLSRQMCLVFRSMESRKNVGCYGISRCSQRHLFVGTQLHSADVNRFNGYKNKFGLLVTVTMIATVFRFNGYKKNKFWLLVTATMIATVFVPNMIFLCLFILQVNWTPWILKILSWSTETYKTSSLALLGIFLWSSGKDILGEGFSIPTRRIELITKAVAPLRSFMN